MWYPKRVLYNQSDYDKLVQGCDTWDGDLIIGRSYTGDLVLTGLVNITGDLRSTDSDRAPAAVFSVPNLTSIVGPDLVQIAGGYGLNMKQATKLRSLNFEMLQSTSALYINMDVLGHIEDADDGGLSLHFPSLKNIEGNLIVSGSVHE